MRLNGTKKVIFFAYVRAIVTMNIENVDTFFFKFNLLKIIFLNA